MSHLSILPGSNGLRFIQGTSELPARLDFLADTDYSNTLRLNDFEISTVEHLLAAFYLCGITDADIEIKGSEVPILDGSARPYVELLKEAGRSPLEKHALCLRIMRSVTARRGDSFARLEPSLDFELEVSIDYDHPKIGRQSFSARVGEECRNEDFVSARTFGFLEDEHKLHSLGLALGTSAENTLLFSDAKSPAPEMRYVDEPVRHKALDALGDLSLLGFRIAGRYVAHKAGHGLNALLLRKLIRERENYQIEYL